MGRSTRSAWMIAAQVVLIAACPLGVVSVPRRRCVWLRVRLSASPRRSRGARGRPCSAGSRLGAASPAASAPEPTASHPGSRAPRPGRAARAPRRARERVHGCDGCRSPCGQRSRTTRAEPRSGHAPRHRRAGPQASCPESSPPPVPDRPGPRRSATTAGREARPPARTAEAAPGVLEDPQAHRPRRESGPFCEVASGDWRRGSGRWGRDCSRDRRAA